MISYVPFFRTIKKKKISQYKLINEYDVPPATLQKLRKNENINLLTLESLCRILKCGPSDIVEFIEVPNNTES